MSKKNTPQEENQADEQKQEKKLPEPTAEQRKLANDFDLMPAFDFLKLVEWNYETFRNYQYRHDIDVPTLVDVGKIRCVRKSDVNRWISEKLDEAKKHNDELKKLGEWRAFFKKAQKLYFEAEARGEDPTKLFPDEFTAELVRRVDLSDPKKSKKPSKKDRMDEL